MRAIFGSRLVAAAVTLSLSGCFAVVDVDRFHTVQKSAPDSSVLNQPGDTYLSLKLSLIGMKPHVTQRFEYRIIDANNGLQSCGVVNPLGGPDVTINVPRAIPTNSGVFHLDFFADVDGSGGYNGIGSVITNDHAWRIDPLVDYPAGLVPPVDGLVQVTFTHNTLFTDINQYPSGTPNPVRLGLDAVVHVINADALHGDLVQVRVADTVANRTVGLFRVPQIAQAAFDLTIPGIVEVATDYVVFVYVDANANSVYDNPAAGLGDLGWSLPVTSTAAGLDVTLDATTVASAKVDVGAP